MFGFPGPCGCLLGKEEIVNRRRHDRRKGINKEMRKRSKWRGRSLQVQAVWKILKNGRTAVARSQLTLAAGSVRWWMVLGSIPFWGGTSAGIVFFFFLVYRGRSGIKTYRDFERGTPFFLAPSKLEKSYSLVISKYIYISWHASLIYDSYICIYIIYIICFFQVQTRRKIPWPNKDS